MVRFDGKVEPITLFRGDFSCVENEEEHVAIGCWPIAAVTTVVLFPDKGEIVKPAFEKLGLFGCWYSC